jgi:hypothetical protein
MIGAAVTGAGLGLAYFGALRLATRSPGPGGLRLWLLGRWAGLALAAATFYALSREGVGAVLAGLLGLWLARGCLIRDAGKKSHGR